MLLYEGAFEKQGFKLALDDYKVEVLYILDHFSDLFGVIVLGAEIGRHTVFEAFCLSDIDDLAGGVLHNIDSRLLRQA